MTDPRMFRYEALLIDPTMDEAFALRGMVAKVFGLPWVPRFLTFSQALSALGTRYAGDAVVVSDLFPPEQLAAFFRQVRKTPGGRDATFYRVVRTDALAPGGPVGYSFEFCEPGPPPVGDDG